MIYSRYLIYCNRVVEPYLISAVGRFWEATLDVPLSHWDSSLFDLSCKTSITFCLSSQIRSPSTLKHFCYMNRSLLGLQDLFLHVIAEICIDTMWNFLRLNVIFKCFLLYSIFSYSTFVKTNRIVENRFPLRRSVSFHHNNGWIEAVCDSALCQENLPKNIFVFWKGVNVYVIRRLPISQTINRISLCLFLGTNKSFRGHQIAHFHNIWAALQFKIIQLILKFTFLAWFIFRRDCKMSLKNNCQNSSSRGHRNMFPFRVLLSIVQCQYQLSCNTVSHHL